MFEPREAAMVALQCFYTGRVDNGVGSLHCNMPECFHPLLDGKNSVSGSFLSFFTMSRNCYYRTVPDCDAYIYVSCTLN